MLLGIMFTSNKSNLYLSVQLVLFKANILLLCAGELHITTKDFTGEMEDELDVKEGETVEVIHKLLDGWWVVRYKPTSKYWN